MDVRPARRNTLSSDEPPTSIGLFFNLGCAKHRQQGTQIDVEMTNFVCGMVRQTKSERNCTLTLQCGTRNGGLRHNGR